MAKSEERTSDEVEMAKERTGKSVGPGSIPVWSFVILHLLLATLALSQSYSSGLILEQAGQVDQAFEEYRLAVNKNSQDLPAYGGLVRLSQRLERYDTLVAVSRRLVKLQSDRPDYSFGLVGGLLGMKRTADARAEARRAAGKWPDRLPALGDMFARYKDYAPAIEYFEQAGKQSANPLSVADRLVELYDAAGQPIPATREMVLVLNTRPQALAEYRQKLSAFAARGAPGLIGELEKVKDPVIRARAQAAVYLALKQDAEAVRVLKPVLSGQELYQFAHVCEAQGALKAALAVYQDQKAHVDAARVLRLMGRSKEAQAELAQDSGSGAQVELGDLYRDQGDFPQAAESYQRVLARQPDNEPAAFGLASALLGLGRTGPARAAARGKSEEGSPKPSSSVLNPQSSILSSDRLLLLVARTFFYEGQFDSAGAYVAELVKRFPQSRLVNDGLELAVLTGSGDRAKELARLMLDYETGAGGTDQARALAKGNDPVAEQAYFLLARFLRREHKPKDALAALDEYRQRFGTSSLAPKARLEQASVYLDDLRDEAKYRETLQQLIVESPGSAYVPIARSLLAEAGKPVAPGGIR
ncbi:MAG: tetratricopeptide repeat protein [candidate division WOR-3 bacterium]|nr:tetratricopeptide repeat protein [candidate division WOR-3 bacterium]